jgi:glycosyltransferase involved in cell wall biosynthesis
MRVLHIIDSLSMGGAETWLVEMVKYTATTETHLPKFDFIIAGGKKAIFDDTVIDLKSKVYYLKLDKDSTWSFIQGFRKILKENKYVAIHDHQDYLSGWHFLFGIGMLPPVRVVHIHNPYYQLINNYGVSSGRRMKQKTGRWLMKNLSTHIFGTSSQILQEYNITLQLFPRQNPRPLNCAFRISNFIGTHSTNKEALCRELGWPLDTNIVLFAGRFDQSLDFGHPNNHKNSAFAVQVLKQTGADTRMIMAGENEFIHTAFTNYIRENDLGDRIVLLGVRRDMNYLMLAADVLIFPSREEGMGMVAIEAQASGLPVLASEKVPAEVLVLPGMVKFLGLEKSFREWADTLLEMLPLRRQGDTVSEPQWAISSFNMEVCCRRLNEVYLGHQ